MDEKPNHAQLKPRRRWHQFGLRTLLLGVAILGVLCSWVGYQLKTVRAREAWLNAHSQSGSDFTFPVTAIYGEGPFPNLRPSMVRTWLGDQPHEIIWIFNKSDRAEAAALFPESQVCLWQGATQY